GDEAKKQGQDCPQWHFFPEAFHQQIHQPDTEHNVDARYQRSDDAPPDGLTYNLGYDDHVIDRDDSRPTRFAGLFEHFPQTCDIQYDNREVEEHSTYPHTRQ